MMNTVPIHTLQPRSRFLLPLSGKTGTVEEHSAASTTVKYDSMRETSFTTSEGQEVTFEKPERTNISLATEVVPLD